MPELDLPALQAWTGRSQVQHDVVTTAPLHGRPLADGEVMLWACTAEGALALQAEATLA